MEQVIVGIGSNLNEPCEQVRRAFSSIADLPDTCLSAHSSIYISRPQGPKDQGNFCNAVALLETGLSPESLLFELQSIEMQFGRVKTRHWGERIIDLDVIFYGQQTINSQEPDLVIPHPQALMRDFVIVPTLEICPEWHLPSGEQLSGYLEKLECSFLERKTVSF